MLAVITILVGIAIGLLFVRAGRRNSIAYRKKVAPPGQGYSVNDHPCAFGRPAKPDKHPGTDIDITPPKNEE